MQKIGRKEEGHRTITSSIETLIMVIKSDLVRFTLKRGARYLTGEKLKVVWAEFSILSQAVLLRV